MIRIEVDEQDPLNEMLIRMMGKFVWFSNLKIFFKEVYLTARPTIRKAQVEILTGANID